MIYQFKPKKKINEKSAFLLHNYETLFFNKGNNYSKNKNVSKTH